MGTNKYLVTFYLEWNDRTTSSGTLIIPVRNLKELFDQLYEKIVMGSIVDQELYGTEMINEIKVEIMKKPVGRLKTNQNDK